MTLPAPLQAEIDKQLNAEPYGLTTEHLEARAVIRQLMEHIEKVEDNAEIMEDSCNHFKLAWELMQNKYTALRQAGDALREALGKYVRDFPEHSTWYSADEAIANYDKLTNEGSSSHETTTPETE